MTRGKPYRKTPRSQAKGKSKHDDKKSREKGRDGESKQVNGGIDETEVNEVDPVNQLDNAESRKYSKRKVESNWDRYEEPEVDDHVVVDDYDETKDFDYIRQNSASAASHFKFKEEQQWESDLHRGSADNKGVLGLNLMQLAEDLKHYGLEEKLGLNSLMPEECKYCVTDILKNTQNLHQSTTFQDDLSGKSERILWSFDGIEKYKNFIGLTQCNMEMQRQQQPEQSNTARCSSKDETMNNELNRVDIKETNIRHKDSFDKKDSKEDGDILDELLLNKITINDSFEQLNDSQDENKYANDSDFVGSNKDSSTTKHVVDDWKSGSDNHNNHDDNILCKSTNHEELDLDMLLEAEIISSESSSMKNNVEKEKVNADLDQWLDDMLI